MNTTDSGGGDESRLSIILSKGRLVGAVASLLLLPMAVWGGGVVTNCTEADLRAAMAGGGVVTFACDGTIALSSTITNDLDVTLDGTDHQVIISGGSTVQVLSVCSNVTFTLLNVTIANGRSSNGGGVYNAGSVNASNCAFVGNVAQGETNARASGGALFNQGWLSLAGCVLTSNLALGAAGSACTLPPDFPATPGQSALGGAIASSGPLRVDLCTFVQNSTRGGVGGLGYDGQPYGWPSYPGADGGAAYGGAIYSSAVLNVSHSTFVGNGVYGGNGGRGGAGAYGVFSSGGDGAVGGNGGLSGGSAVCFSAGTVASSTLVSNSAVGGAGGAGGYGGYATSDVVSPGAGALGGSGGSALGVVYGGRIANCTLAQNIARGGAGGEGGWGGSPVLPKYPFGIGAAGGAGANGLGGLCYCTSVNCTVASNSGSGGTGGTGGYGRISGANGANGSAGGGATASILANTLLATNSPGGNGFGTLTDLGHNLSSDNTCNFTNVGSLKNTDPKLGPLADNGGPTLTMALLLGSPAIDAGDTALAPSTDQRDFPRPVGPAADIGAYELCYQPVLRIDPPQAGLVSIRAYGTNDQTCRLLAGPNLSDWTPIATNQLGSDGTVSFYDTCVPGDACRFYRLVMP